MPGQDPESLGCTPLYDRIDESHLRASSVAIYVC
jgi:hypothetical protein